MSDVIVAFKIVGANRGDNIKRFVKGDIKDILKFIYSKAENHDTVIIYEAEEVHLTGNEKGLKENKTVCVKLDCLTNDEIKQVTKELDIKGLNIVRGEKWVK